IRKEKLASALDTVKRVTRAQLNALGNARAKPAARSHISARVHGDIQLVNVDAIRYFQAEQKYITVRHGEGEVLIDESLRSLEGEFGERFQRVHRNALVALAYLEKLEKDADGHCYVRMRGIEDRLQVSRRHLSALRKRMRSGN
ncbi:MAG: LytTR family transcriptional regulator, partial [Pseudomonadota bacterium]